MFRKGTRVVIVDEKTARSLAAGVRNGQTGTIGAPRGTPDHVNVHMDGDPSPIAWAMPATCVKRIRKPKKV